MSGEIKVIYKLTQDNTFRMHKSASSMLMRRRRKKPFLVLIAVVMFVAIGAVASAELWFDVRLQPSHMVAFYFGLFCTLALVIGNRRLLLHESAERAIAGEDMRGDVTARFTPDGVHFESGAGFSMTIWQAVSELMIVKDGTVIRMGNVLNPIPDASIDIDADAFRAQLQAWKDAKS